MANVNVFQNTTKSIPKGNDSQIVRVSMDQLEIGGRKAHLPKQSKSDVLSISHIPNRG
ncbi:MAG: hypothetical protein KGL35_30085 [Bradyrhizobium sp.]|nr:hypothetical protein [Bradyrhizobium sp.]